MSYVILDLEWNAAFYKKEQRYINEIIEFGAVKVDDELNITDTFSTLVKPKIGKRLCSKVKELTGLSLDELKQGVTFAQAVESFTEFASDSVIMTWGTSDIH
ncbi:MAG: exonuclease domain-containing protein, partial [Ruminococcus sp.]|nr:exonuclease domain-containing protein [Ruminococcus sp.]